MAAPTTKTNLEKIQDCLAHNLAKITHANGYRTNGMIVDKDHLPENVVKDKVEDYGRLRACVTVRIGLRKRVRGGASGLSQSVRYEQVIELWALTSLRPDAIETVTIGVKEANLQKDLFQNLFRDTGLRTAGAELHALDASAGYDRISCMNLLMDDSLPRESQPHESSVVHYCSCTYDEFQSIA